MSTNPNTVKSQHELNDGKRSSEVLIEAISKAERLQKQLDIANKALEEIEKNGTNPDVKSVVALCVNNFLLAHKARLEIKELDNG